MPELPEVETVVRGLYDKLIDRTVTVCYVSDKKLRADSYDSIEDEIIGLKFTHLYRRGKYIIANLSNEKSLLIHLGMSGKLMVLGADEEQKKHDHIKLWLGNDLCLTFNDPRRFGCFVLDKTDNILAHPLLQTLGIEPLADNFTPETLTDLLKGKSGNIKSFLMNAKYIVGVGNIYASEALFLAKIHPLRACSSIKNTEAKKLYKSIKDVLLAAIESGGSTLRDYVNSDGDLGYFQHKFNVYGKDKSPCVRCKKPIEKLVIAGRSTFFCPKCQM